MVAELTSARELVKRVEKENAKLKEENAELVAFSRKWPLQP